MPPFEDLIEKSVKIMEIQGKSKQTIRNYRFALSIFHRFVDKPMMAVTETDINNYLESLQVERKVTDSTRGSYLAVIKAFFGYAHRRNWISGNPAADIPDIQGERRVRIPLTKYDNDQLLKVAAEQPTDRYWLLTKTLYDSMIRVSEITRILKKDVDFDNRTIKIYGKGASTYGGDPLASEQR